MAARLMDRPRGLRAPPNPNVQTIADPVLLLHGQPGNARDWDRVRHAIGDRAQTIQFDRPGWNGGGAPSDLAGNARAALTELDRRGVARARVVGHSLGGAVAAWLAAVHPDRVSTVVLAAPSANRASLNHLDQMFAAPMFGPLLAATTFACGGLALATPPLRRRIATEYGLDERYLRRYARALLSPRTWAAFTLEQRMLIRDLPKLEGRLGSISVPVTVVIGTADRIVTPSSARALAAGIPTARLVEVQGASHLLVQQHPAELADVIVAPSRDDPAAID
jgi:pimeloyl-ACP methyl ester carboxylesterase